MAQTEFKSLIAEIGYDTIADHAFASQIEKTFKSTGDKNLDKYVLGQVFEAQTKVGTVAADVREIIDTDVPKLTRVRPGDLITAGLLNGIMDAVEALELRTRRIAVALQRKDPPPRIIGDVAVAAPPAPPVATAVPPRKGPPTANYRKRGEGYVMTIEAEDIDRGTVKGIRVGDKLFAEEDIKFYDGKMTVMVDTKPVEDMAVVIEKTNKAPVAILATPAISKKTGVGAVAGIQKIER
jgi:hypothetical protein